MNSYKKISSKDLNKHSKVVNGVRYVNEGVHLLDYTSVEEVDNHLFSDLDRLIKYNSSYNFCYNGEESQN